MTQHPSASGGAASGAPIAAAPAIVAVGPEEAGRVVGVITLAFAADPPSRWLFPEAESYLRHFPSFVRALGGAALAARTAQMTPDGAAVALWLAPDAAPDEEALAALIEDAVAPGKRATMAAAVEQMIRCHPQEPHWYLPFIAVEPARQSGGLGAALLRAQLAACDRAGLPAYLESSNPRNRPLYERHGFVPITEIKVGDCPPIMPMLRRPLG
jgi:GNAT superfamily N-acetyltransferase